MINFLAPVLFPPISHNFVFHSALNREFQCYSVTVRKSMVGRVRFTPIFIYIYIYINIDIFLGFG